MNEPVAKSRRTGVIVALVVAIAAATGFFGQRHFAPSAPGLVPDPDAVASSPAAAPGPAAAPADSGAPSAATVLTAAPTRALPDTLPDFELTDSQGVKRKLSYWAGRPLVVNYWATWCPPCVREIPLLRKLRADRAASKLEVVGIAVDFRDDVLAFAKREHLDYPLLIGEEDGLAAVEAVGMTPAFPFTLFADSKHRIVALKVGELHQPELDLIVGTVAKVDAGTLDLPAARTRITEGLKLLATDKATKPARSTSN
jgi:peroxiredoxin